MQIFKVASRIRVLITWIKKNIHALIMSDMYLMSPSLAIIYLPICCHSALNAID